jgi:thiol-disulfide isomerase/thioredoxin
MPRRSAYGLPDQVPDRLTNRLTRRQIIRAGGLCAIAYPGAAVAGGMPYDISQLPAPETVAVMSHGTVRDMPSVLGLQNATGSQMLIAPAPGRSLMLINLWATWCGPCREEMPTLLRLAGQHRTEFDVVMVAEGQAFTAIPTTIRADASRAGAILLADPGHHIADILPVLRPHNEMTFPSTLIVSAKGLIVGLVAQAANWDAPGTGAWLTRIAAA